MRLYFAGPLFCHSERHFNSNLAVKIEALGYEVFLPQESGIEEGETLESLGAEAWSQKIFNLDRDAVLESDVVLFILDGRVPDEGMCVELGLAYADRQHRGKPRHLIGYSTDFRQFSVAGLNAMLSGALDEVLNDEASLVARLGEILAG
jgi:nucleoside 2-deoxyribosyltransferase